jgi:hypothetical protein
MSRRAGVLLEVVIALTVLVTAMGLLSAQVVSGLNMTTYAEDQLRVSQLMDRILALTELDPNVQQRVLEAGLEPVTDQFGKQYPGYFWQVQVEPADPDDPNQELGLVTVAVLHQPDREHADSLDGAQVMRTVAFLKAKPASIDLTQLGLDANGLTQAGLPAELAAQLPELLSLLGGFESSTVSIQQIMATLDPQTLQTIMPMLQTLLAQAGGGELPTSAEDLTALLGQLGAAGGGFPRAPAGGTPAAVAPGGAPGAAGPTRPGVPGARPAAPARTDSPTAPAAPGGATPVQPPRAGRGPAARGRSSAHGGPAAAGPPAGGRFRRRGTLHD